MRPSDLVDALDALEWLESIVVGKARRRPALLTDDGFLQSALRLGRRLQRVVGLRIGSPAFRDRFLRSSAIDWQGADSAARARALDAIVALIRSLPSEVVPGAKVALKDVGRQVVQSVHRELGAKHPKVVRVDPIFDQKNERAIEALSSSSAVFFNREYERRATDFRARAQRTVAAGLEQGFGRREIAGTLRDQFGPTVAADSYWETVAANHVARARSFSAVATYAESGVERYQWLAIMDERTTPLCFPPGTPIMVEAGRRRGIETMMPGDEVLGRDGKLHAVEAVMVRESSEWVEIELDDGRVLRSTPNHPYWSARSAASEEGWTPAEDLQPGSVLRALRESRPVASRQAESVLLPRMSAADQGGAGLGRSRVLALRQALQDANERFQPARGHALLLASMQESGQKTGAFPERSRAGLPGLQDAVHDQAGGAREETITLLDGMPEAHEDWIMRGLRGRVQHSVLPSDCSVLLASVLPEIRSGIGTGGACGTVLGRARGPIRTRGAGRTIRRGLRLAGLLDRARGRREILAPARGLREGRDADAGWATHLAGGRGRDLAWRPDDPCPGAPRFDRVLVRAVRRIREVAPAINLQIADDPVYLVDGILAHNCAALHGRTFSVKKAMDHYDGLERARSLRQVEGRLAPFGRDNADGEIELSSGALLSPRASVAEFQAAGIHAPPAHHRCRSTIVPVFD